MLPRGPLPGYRQALIEKDAQKATNAENIQKERKTYNQVEEIVTVATTSRQLEDVDDVIVRGKENCFTKMTVEYSVIQVTKFC